MKSPIHFLVLVAVIMLSALPALGQRYFNNLPKNDNITTVYIGKAMLRLAGSAIKNNDDYGPAATAIKSLTGVEVVTCENRKVYRKDVEPVLKRILDSQNLETMIDTTDGDEKTMIYGTDNGDGLMTQMIIVNSEPGSYNIVVIHGKIDVAALVKAYSK